jgi:rhamnogalacturonan hydrolase
MFSRLHVVLSGLWLLTAVVSAQLSGRVGPTSTHQSKSAKKVCNILNFGAKAGKSGDVGPALMSAFAACKTGGTIVIPPGDYALNTWVNFNGGGHYAIQWDGIIHRTGGAGGNMILVQHSDDVEIFSTTGRGAMNSMQRDLFKDRGFCDSSKLQTFRSTMSPSSMRRHSTLPWIRAKTERFTIW